MNSINRYRGKNQQIQGKERKFQITPLIIENEKYCQTCLNKNNLIPNIHKNKKKHLKKNFNRSKYHSLKKKTYKNKNNKKQLEIFLKLLKEWIAKDEKKMPLEK